MNLRVLQREVREWSERNFPNNEPVDPLLGAMEELGELCHAHLKGKQGIRHSLEEIEAMKADAVADTIIYLADYCSRNDIDLGLAVLATWEKVKQRDWQKDPKGGDGQ